MNRVAIIDLGTNTFNLLIVQFNPDKTYAIICQTKISVKLGEGGITKGFIAPESFQRGIDALKMHRLTIQLHNAETVIAFATSAIREAVNGKDFIAEAKKTTKIDVEMISGDREAELIYYGVRDAVEMSEKASLIIDIGGGSTEFIIASKYKVFWKKSFLLGAARLLEKFNPSDPIKEEEMKAIYSYLKLELQPLYQAVEKFPVAELIGSSGSFDSLAEMIAYKFYTPEILKGKKEYTFSMPDCAAIYKILMKSTKKERLEMKGLISMRVDMIVISSILVHFILTEFDIHHMRLSTYSLKEGVLHELAQ
ncbi:MAG TPA: exopolyphosphatase [Chitinophagales bacterium]|nr:exopolyphosphatase [Chitinophagales bacterium]